MFLPNCSCIEHCHDAKLSSLIAMMQNFLSQLPWCKFFLPDWNDAKFSCLIAMTQNCAVHILWRCFQDWSPSLLELSPVFSLLSTTTNLKRTLSNHHPSHIHSQQRKISTCYTIASSFRPLAPKDICLSKKHYQTIWLS